MQGVFDVIFWGQTEHYLVEYPVFNTSCTEKSI